MAHGVRSNQGRRNEEKAITSERRSALQRKWPAVVKERLRADSLLFAGELARLAFEPARKRADLDAALRECLAIR